MSEQQTAMRPRLHAMWDSVAPAWAAQADAIEARNADLMPRMLELAQPAPGERVVDLACGPGGAGIAAAPLVEPGGEVVLSDVSPAMVAAAAERAAGLAHVHARVLDLEEIDEPDASFDLALCREGLMLVADPVRAAAEIRRILRPGGRTAVAVWGPREQNPWLGLVADALSAETGQELPVPGAPHPFSLGAPGQLRGVLERGGLSDVAVEEVAVPYRAASAGEWFDGRIELAGPLAQKVRTLPAGVLDAARERAFAAVRRYETPFGIELPGAALLAFARRR